MLKIKDLDVSLSLKLGDVVSIERADGKIFDYKLRLGYLQRAVAKLYRDLPLLMSTYAPLFAQNFVPFEQTLTDENGLKDSIVTIEYKDGEGETVSQTLETVSELFPTFEKGNAKPVTIKAAYAKPDKYLSMLFDQDDASDASFDKKKLFYTIMDNKVYLIPKATDEHKYTKISLVFKKDLETITGDTELNIGKDYEDLLLSMSALEGMQDIARSDKVQLYTNEVNSQLKILQGYASYKIQKEGSKANG